MKKIIVALFALALSTSSCKELANDDVAVINFIIIDE
mgnify:CR=1 FL=1